MIHLHFIASAVALSLCILPSDAIADLQSALKKAQDYQKKYEQCEIAYFTEILSSNVEEIEKERFLGGFSGYESWQSSKRFVFASNDTIRQSNVTATLRKEAKPDLGSYRLITLTNERYQARVESTPSKAYSLRGRFPPGEFDVLPQHSVRFLFAPNLEDWSDALAARFVPETSFAGVPCCSIEFERRIPEDNPPSWEHRTIFLDIKDWRCLGQKVVYSDSSSFDVQSAVEEYAIEYDPQGLPSRILRKRTGQYEFNQVYELVHVALSPQASEPFFLPHYGIDDSNRRQSGLSFGFVMITIGISLLGLGAASQWIARRRSR